MLAGKFSCFRFGLAVCFICGTLLNNGLVRAQDDEEQNNSTIISCYDCESTPECFADQDEENATSVECNENQHCWIWSEEEEGKDADPIYRRSCGEPCTDESREMDCKTSDNRTECAICCSDNLCNDGSVNASYTPQVSIMYFWVNFVISLIFGLLRN